MTTLPVLADVNLCFFFFLRLFSIEMWGLVDPRSLRKEDLPFPIPRLKEVGSSVLWTIVVQNLSALRAHGISALAIVVKPC